MEEIELLFFLTIAETNPCPVVYCAQNLKFYEG